jgi:chromosome segregation ATPase
MDSVSHATDGQSLRLRRSRCFLSTKVDRARLGPGVAADLDAIVNDMEQAQHLAAEYQRELAGKSNELATLKQLFEKTRQHLIQLQTSVTKLRDKRHRLANEAMRAEALQRKLDVATAERDRLKDEQARRMWGE